MKFNPENLYVRHQLRRLISIIVPFWHARMLNDTTRNDAFQRAIQAAIIVKEDGKRVFWTLAPAAVCYR